MENGITCYNEPILKEAGSLWKKKYSYLKMTDS